MLAILEPTSKNNKFCDPEKKNINVKCLVETVRFLSYKPKQKLWCNHEQKHYQKKFESALKIKKKINYTFNIAKCELFMGKKISGKIFSWDKRRFKNISAN